MRYKVFIRGLIGPCKKGVIGQPDGDNRPVRPPQSSATAELSRGQPSAEGELMRPRHVPPQSIVSCLDTPNVSKDQLGLVDPTLLCPEPLQRLRDRYKASALVMPSPPAPLRRAPASLAFNQHLADAWRRHELALSQWDPHPKRSRLSMPSRPPERDQGDAALSQLLAEVRRMRLPRCR